MTLKQNVINNIIKKYDMGKLREWIETRINMKLKLRGVSFRISKRLIPKGKIMIIKKIKKKVLTVTV